jgi:hypothetical protein
VRRPQRERTLEVGQRGGGGQPSGGIGGVEERSEGGGLVAGAVEVDGQLAGRVAGGQREAGRVPERVGDGAVQAASFGGQQPRVHDLADERVAHPVGVAGRVDDQQPGVDGPSGARFHGRLVEPEGGLDQLGGGVTSDGGHRGEDLAGPFRELRDVGREEL